MPTLRFPDLRKQRLDKEGKYRVRIYHIEFSKNEKDKTIMKITFEILKSGKVFSQSFPLNQYHNSLLHQNLRIWLANEKLVTVKTDDLLGLECRIQVFKNENGYLQAKAIPKKKSLDSSAE